MAYLAPYLASILALALIIERAIALQRKNSPGNAADRCDRHLEEAADHPDVLTKLEANSPLGRVLAAGLRNERTTREGAMQQIEAAGAVVANRLTKNLTLLGSIGSIAPLLGLLGTVVGMIAIFASQQAGSNPQDLARGISVALLHRARDHRGGTRRACVSLLQTPGRRLSGRHGRAGRKAARNRVRGSEA